MPGASVLRYAGGGAIIAIEKAADIRLTGLTLAGEAKPIDGGGLLIAESVKGLTVSDCRIVGSAEDGVMLRKVSGRVSDCEIGPRCQHRHRHRRLGDWAAGKALITDNLISGAKDGAIPGHERCDVDRPRPRDGFRCRLSQPRGLF